MKPNPPKVNKKDNTKPPQKQQPAQPAAYPPPGGIIDPEIITGAADNLDDRGRFALALECIGWAQHLLKGLPVNSQRAPHVTPSANLFAAIEALAWRIKELPNSIEALIQGCEKMKNMSEAGQEEKHSEWARIQQNARLAVSDVVDSFGVVASYAPESENLSAVLKK